MQISADGFIAVCRFLLYNAAIANNIKKGGHIVDKIKTTKTGTADVKLPLVLALCAVALAFCLALTFLIASDISSTAAVDISGYDKSTPKNFFYSADVVYSDNRIDITGFALTGGESALTFDTWVCLYDENEQAYIKIPTAMRIDEGINAIVADGVSYGRSGFTAFVELAQLDSAAQAYEICFLYTNSQQKYLVHTGHKLESGIYSNT